MKQFINKIVLFSLIPLGLLFVMELSITILNKSIFKENALEKYYKEDAKSYAWVDKLSNDSLNIISGSSSVRYGLSCNKLSKLNPDNSLYINLATDARDPIQTYFILKNSNLNNVKSIYFGLDPWIYTKSYYKFRNVYLYLDFTFTECLKYYKEHDKSVFTKRYNSFCKYLFNRPQLPLTTNKKTPTDYGSIALNNLTFNEISLSDWFQTKKYGWSSLQFKYLKKIEALCQEENIKFSLFIPPKHSSYTEYYKTNHILDHKVYNQKIEEAGLKASIFSSFDILEQNDESGLFSEAVHLNKTGQNIFSEIFYDLSQKKHKEYSRDYKWF